MTSKLKKRRVPKKRSVPAKALADRRFHQRVVAGKKRQAKEPSYFDVAAHAASAFASAYREALRSPTYRE